MGHIATLILAAGFSTRMQGPFKPLLPLHFAWPKARKLSALEATVNLHLHCGVEQIFVVSGQRENAALTEVVTQLQAGLRQKQNLSLVPNPLAKRGMFSSVCEGLHALQSSDLDMEQTHCFIHPVDIPLIRPCTLQALLQAQKKHPQEVLLPTYKGVSGHPPLIPATYIQHILQHNGEQGLQGALKGLPQRSIPTPDSHILLDMDTQEDYAFLQAKALRQHTLHPAEALELLHCLDVPPQGIAHAQSVARVATTFAKAYVRKAKIATQKPTINTPLAKVGALLHDMCKQEPRHEQAAGRVLRELNLGYLAPLVEEHNDCQLNDTLPVTEKELIYLADKYVHGKRFVPIAQRFEQKLQLYTHIPEACLAIKARLSRAKAMEERVARELGIQPALLAEEVLQDQSDCSCQH